MSDEKPAYLFLKREFFDLFAAGSKTIEWRAWRLWFTDRNYRPGRAIIIRNGYNKGDAEIRGTIIETRKVARADASPIAAAIYPDAKFFCAIEIRVQPKESKQ